MLAAAAEFTKQFLCKQNSKTVTFSANDEIRLFLKRSFSIIRVGPSVRPSLFVNLNCPIDSKLCMVIAVVISTIKKV